MDSISLCFSLITRFSSVDCTEFVALVRVLCETDTKSARDLMEDILVKDYKGSQDQQEERLVNSVVLTSWKEEMREEGGLGRSLGCSAALNKGWQETRVKTVCESSTLSGRNSPAPASSPCSAWRECGLGQKGTVVLELTAGGCQLPGFFNAI